MNQFASIGPNGRDAAHAIEINLVKLPAVNSQTDFRSSTNTLVLIILRVVGLAQSVKDKRRNMVKNEALFNKNRRLKLMDKTRWFD